MLPWVCSVIDHRRRQNVVRTSASRLPYFVLASTFLSMFFERFNFSTEINMINRGPRAIFYLIQSFLEPFTVLEMKHYQVFLF